MCFSESNNNFEQQFLVGAIRLTKSVGNCRLSYKVTKIVIVAVSHCGVAITFIHVSVLRLS